MSVYYRMRIKTHLDPNWACRFSLIVPSSYLAGRNASKTDQVALEPLFWYEQPGKQVVHRCERVEQERRIVMRVSHRL